MGIALIILLIILLCWPKIMKWIGNFMAKRAEDYLRKATGMPPRPGSREARRQARQRQASNSGEYTGRNSRQGGYNSNRNTYSGYSEGPIIPKEYAEDVEFVETIDYSETSIAEDSGQQARSDFHESQVSDAEWVEIKPKHGKKK